MKVTLMPIVIGGLGTVTKELVQGLEALEIRTARILTRVQNYIIYGKDFRFVPSDPVCFDKLSRYD